MQNKFGLKDFILLVCVIGVGLMVLLSMIQEDRRFRDVKELTGKVQLLETRLANLQDTLESTPPIPAGFVPGQHTGATQRNTDWAKPGDAPISWFENFAHVTPPRDQPGFQAGGTFTEIFEGQPPTVTPYRYADVYGRRVVDLVCEALGKYHPQTLEMSGLLAEAWQYDPQGYWLRVKIRDRARFSDNTPVTAEDVRFTFHDIVMNPQIEADRFRSTLEVIDRVEVVSPKVVDFFFKRPMFSNRDAALAMNIIPKHIYQNFTEQQINESTALLVGSGPFRLARLDPDNQWKPGETLRLVRNESYWGPRPAYERLHFSVISDSLPRLVALLNGDGDMIRPLAPQFVDRADDVTFNERFERKLWYNIRGGYSFIGWQCGPRNGKLTPFHDKRVRLAMTHLIDREKIIRDISRGIGRVATGPDPSESPVSDPDITPWPYDLDTASRLLREAGWNPGPDGVLRNAAGERFEFELTFGQGNEGTLQMVNYVKDQCAMVGIVCTLRAIDWSILADILNQRNFDAITFAWSANAPESDPNQIWHSRSIEGTGDNFIQWANPEADRLIDLGRETINDEQRFEIWRQLHRVFHEEQPYTFLSEAPWLRIINRRVNNVQEYKTGIEYGEFFISAPGAPAMMPN